MKKYINPALNIETLNASDVISASLNFFEEFAQDIQMKWEWTEEDGN